MARARTRVGLSCLTIFTVGLLVVPPVQAQMQGYPAYGAWRGRARTVETRYGTRSHVRWGGGITPAAAGMFTTILTNPDFLGTVGGIASLGLRSGDDSIMYLSQEDLEAVREARQLKERQLEEQSRSERAESRETIRQILEVHSEILDRLAGSQPAATDSTELGVRTEKFLADVREIHASQGGSPKLPAARREGTALEERYRTIHDAIRQTNAALEALEKARRTP